ncbi:MAG: hypothetical protein IT569_02225 [Leptospiraceae bacterium]|nr:hypothetical protein [Leptospiraceae bacterium]
MPLGENLIAKGFITKDQLDIALNKQKESPGEKIGVIIEKLGFASKEQIESSL